MVQLDLKQLCQELIDPIKSVGAYIVKKQKHLNLIDVEHKSLNSLVSEVDVEAERQLVKMLSIALPSAGFLTEEKTTVQSENQLRWIIDPLDGTTNFLHGLPHFAISIALEKDDEIQLAFVYDCSKDELFHARKGEGAWLNGRAIRVSRTDRLGDSLLSTGFPYYDFNKMEGYLSLLEYFMKNTRGLRRFGSAALDLAWVACGRYDGFFEYGLNPWDVAGGILLIQEAGGRITDFSDGKKVIQGKEIMGSNGLLHKQLLEKVAEKLL